MVETIPFSQRRVDILLVAFFLINLLFVSYLIDIEQLVIANPAHFTYPIWPRVRSSMPFTGGASTSTHC